MHTVIKRDRRKRVAYGFLWKVKFFLKNRIYPSKWIVDYHKRMDRRNETPRHN
jgi:hypothetical protein